VYDTTTTMSQISSIARTQVFLNGPKDWNEWIMLLEFAALKDDIWQYVDPATPKDKLPELSEPIRLTPTFARELDIDGLYALVRTPTVRTPTESETPTEVGNPKPIARSKLTELEKDKLEELLEEYSHNYKKATCQEPIISVFE
jgi:hypothetical protein